MTAGSADPVRPETADPEPDSSPAAAVRERWGREALAVTAVAGLLTMLMNLPVLKSFSTGVPRDTGDPLYFAWQLSWVTHALTSDPRHFYQPPVYLGASHNLAYTDVVLGYAPLGRLLGDGPENAVRLINLAVLVSIALSFAGAYALARVLGAGPVAALVAGSGFAFAPWRLEQITHINVMSTGVAALALAALCRGHGWSLRAGWEPARVHPGWVLTGWGLACVQLTYGFAIGIMFGWLLLVVVGAWVVGGLIRTRGGRRAVTGLSDRTRRRFVIAEISGGLVFAVVGLLLARPYLWVAEHFPEARRGEEWLFLSPPWRGLLTAPETSVWWGARQAVARSRLVWAPEMVLLPGFVLIGLALLGVFVSAWPLRRRLGLLLGIVVLTILALGIRFPPGGRYTFLPLYHHLYGWDALRTPGRLIIWVTLGLGLLAAGALTRLAELAREAIRRQGATGDFPSAERRRMVMTGLVALATAGLLLPTTAVILEGRGRTPMPAVSFPAVDLTSLPQPVLVLPFDVIGDYRVMAWQTDGWPTLANGSSGFEPKYQEQFRATMKTFPSPDSIAAARSRGIASVVLVRDLTPVESWNFAASQSLVGLDVTRVQAGPDALVYDTR